MGNSTAIGEAQDYDSAAVAVAAEAAFVLDGRACLLLWIDGVLYHMQSVVAYVVMSYLSPVTVSVVNTLKRALLIWISILVFGNKVTPLTQLGTVICLLGALWYNFARQSTTQEASIRGRA